MNDKIVISLKSISYDDINFNTLMADYKVLSSFEDVAKWDSRAQEEVNKIIGVIRDLDAEIIHQTKAFEQENSAYAEKSFVSRLFAKNLKATEISQRIQKFQDYKNTLANMASQLQETIDFTPNSAEEQINLLKELRQHKKELQVEKRAVAAAMKAIRADARQQGVHAGVVNSFLGSYYDSKVGAAERRQIRYAKEASLRPHENEKSAIERQLVQIDRDIMWAEKFKKQGS